jgi:hypothetical protein
LRHPGRVQTAISLIKSGVLFAVPVGDVPLAAASQALVEAAAPLDLQISTILRGGATAGSRGCTLYVVRAFLKV